MPRIRVMALMNGDEESACRSLLARIPEIEVLGMFSPGVDSVPAVSLHKPDVVMLGSHGLTQAPDLTQRIREASTHAGILIIAGGEASPSLAGSLAQDGAIRLMAPTASHRELYECICGLVAADGLSDRERDVLWQLARGYTHKEIAKQLELSIKSVEKYKARSLEKLGLRSRSEVVSYAIQRGWMRD